MSKPPKCQIVEYLARRKFADYDELRQIDQEATKDRAAVTDAMGGQSNKSRADELRKELEKFERRLQEVESYCATLKSKAENELQVLYRDERAKERKERKREAQRKERQRFFNRPGSKANLKHWGKMALWSLDEAVALSLGKSPEVVNWKSVRPYVGRSPFADQYVKIRDLVLRAKTAGDLSDPIWPGKFLYWAKAIRLDYPPNLGDQDKATASADKDAKPLPIDQEALLTNRITSVVLAARRMYPEKPRPPFREMAREVQKKHGNELNFTEDTIRKILAGKYGPMVKRGISRLDGQR